MVAVIAVVVTLSLKESKKRNKLIDLARELKKCGT